MIKTRVKEDIATLTYAPLITWQDIPSGCDEFAIDYGKATGMELSYGKGGVYLGKGRFLTVAEYEHVFRLASQVNKARIVAESSFGSYDLEHEYNLFYEWSATYGVSWSGYRAKLTESYRRLHKLPKLDGQGGSEQESNYIYDIVFRNRMTTRKFHKKFRDNNGYINSEGYVPKEIVKSINMAIEETKGTRGKGGNVQNLILSLRVMKDKKKSIPQVLVNILVNDLDVTNKEGQTEIFNKLLASSCAVRSATAALYCHNHRQDKANNMNVGTIDFYEKLLQSYANRKGGKISSEYYRHVLHSIAPLVIEYSNTYNSGDLIIGHSVEPPLKNKVFKLMRKFFKNFIYDETKVLADVPALVGNDF